MFLIEKEPHVKFYNEQRVNSQFRLHFVLFYSLVLFQDYKSRYCVYMAKTRDSGKWKKSPRIRKYYKMSPNVEDSPVASLPHSHPH